MVFPLLKYSHVMPEFKYIFHILVKFTGHNGRLTFTGSLTYTVFIYYYLAGKCQ